MTSEKRLESLKRLKEEMKRDSFRTSIQQRRDCLSRIVPLLDFNNLYYENAFSVADILGRPGFTNNMYVQAFARIDNLVGQAIAELEHHSLGSHASDTSSGIDPQRTPTPDLVLIVRERAESFQKPEQNDVFWKELVARYLWIGCPKEDLALIADLDRLLRPLNNGYTMLPPQVVPVRGASISPPPPYYQSKVRLSQVIGNPAKQTPQENVAQSSEPSMPIPKPLLEKLRSELNGSQQKYLSLFWEHYLEHRKWPKTVDFHRDHDIKDVQTALRTPPLNGSIVMEQTGSDGEYYELRLPGILLTKDGVHYEDLRIRLLEFLSQKYYHPVKEERKNRYSDEEVKKELKLSDEDAKILGAVGEFDHIYQIFRTSQDGRWAIEFPRKEIQSIPRKGPFADYHEQIVAKQHFPDWKVFSEDRQAAQRMPNVPSPGIFDSFGPPKQLDPTGPSKEKVISPSTPVPDVSLVKDAKLQEFAAITAQEACRCFDVQAFNAAAVMAGSSTEALLLDLLIQHKSKVQVGNRPLEELRLVDLINMALQLNLMGKATGNLTHIVRGNRNLIHPGRSLREKNSIGRGEAEIAMGILRLVCDALK